jgi:hypothetical protein
MSKPGKSFVQLPAGAARPSRIRREPPPRAAAKEPALHDIAEREARTVVIGILLFGLAIAIIIVAVGNYLGR